MPIRPQFQERHHDYVLGPTQDARLTSVVAGAVIEKVKLTLDTDAPFVLRSRALRQSYSSALTQGGLQNLATRWTGPTDNYRQQDFVPESLQSANFGQVGNPGPVFPPILYPAASSIVVDVYNFGTSAISNLTFYWRGVKLFPWGAVSDYVYPKRFKALSFDYPEPINALGVSEFRPNQLFTVKTDADFVLRGAQATAPFSLSDGNRILGEVGFILRDHDKKPYSNDFVAFDVLFGAGSWPSTIPVGPSPSFVAPFGTGPSQPGLFYPEIYVPANHQLWYDVKRSDGAGIANQSENLVVNLKGSKVYPQ